MDGPGCIQRMHFPHSEYGVPGLLGRKDEHIRIYLDGDKKPALDVPLEDIFYGKLAGFPKPLADVALGGFYCYVPIPYRKSCKVVVDGTEVKFYQIVYRTFPTDKEIVTFRYPPTPAHSAKRLAKAAKAWTSCGEIGPAAFVESALRERQFALKAGESLDLDAARRTAYGQGLVADDQAGAGRERRRAPGCKSPGTTPSRPPSICRWTISSARRKSPSCSDRCWRATSTSSGTTSCPCPITSRPRSRSWPSKPLEGTLMFTDTPLDNNPGDLGYLHVAYNESLPTKTGVYHPYLKRQGRGRFIGVYLATDGQNESKLPIWLEGDEQFTCDGELRIHGTGTEDGFNGGWYAVPGRLNGPGVTPLSGFPVYRKEKSGRDVAVAFRWYLTDPVSYDKSIDAELEHGGVNDVNANYRTAAFFYDAAP